MDALEKLRSMSKNLLPFELVANEIEEELEQARGRIHHLEGQYWKQQDRIWQLETLCRNMYATIDGFCVTVADYDRHTDRMEQLGLLGGEQND